MNRHVLQRGALLFLLLLAFALRISGLTAQSLWRDEVDAIHFAQAPLSALLTNFARTGWNGPLFHVLLRFWLTFAGQSEFAVRYLALWLGLIGVALTYRLGQRWSSPRVGGLAALLTACAPYVIWYSQETKMYALLYALGIGVLYVYHHALASRDWRLWATVVVLTWIAMGIHIMGALLIPVMVLFFLVWWPVSQGQWKHALWALIGSVLPGVIASPWVLPLLIRGGNIGHHFVPLPRMATTMLYAFSRGILPSGGSWPMGLAVFAVAAGTTLWNDADLLSWLLDRVYGRGSKLARGNLAGERRYVLAAWAWLIVPVLGLYVISLRVPMFVDRYLIWIGPAFYLLAARGIEQIRRRSPVFAGLCLAAILAFNCWGAWEQSATAIKSDFRAAADYVRQHRQPGEILLFHISYVRETFEYYYGDSSPTTDGVPTDKRTSPTTVDGIMQERTSGYQVIWVVLSEPEMWDQRGLTIAWLEAHARAELRAEFARVSVIRYRMAHKARRSAGEREG